jgi:hypothetical protein
MTIQRRIYFSLPINTQQSLPTANQQAGEEPKLTSAQAHLVEGLAKKIKQSGYVIEVFARCGITDSPNSYIPWTYEDVDRVMRQCVGAVFIGLPHWIVTTADQQTWGLATEFSYYEAGVAVTLGLPRLVLVEEGLLRRVVFDTAYKDWIATFPENAGATWLKSADFQHAFQGWNLKLDQRRDVFLGYSSKSADLAKKIELYLDELGVTVLDWMTDFKPGSSILEQIQEAARRCGGGIFLFTKDDQLVGSSEQVAPRDNVVFEAGYFAAARGKQRVLIVRESDAKMPADLGGDIYASIDDPADITSAKTVIRKFVEERL